MNQTEKLVEALEKILKLTDSVLMTGVINQIDDIAKEALESYKDGWISVEERLPEYGTYVNVFGTDMMQYGIKRIHVCEMNDLEDGIEFKETGCFRWLTEKGTKIDNVTHWQPLPSPPQTKTI